MITERDFATQVEDLLERGDWLWEHPRPARIRVGGAETYRTALSGHKGRPDYLAVRSGRLLFFELKSEKGKLSLEQQQWLDDLEQCQRVILAAPLALRGNKAIANLTKETKVITVPEVYVFRPGDFDKIVDLLR